MKNYALMALSIMLIFSCLDKSAQVCASASELVPIVEKEESASQGSTITYGIYPEFLETPVPDQRMTLHKLNDMLETKTRQRQIREKRALQEFLVDAWHEGLLDFPTNQASQVARLIPDLQLHENRNSRYFALSAEAQLDASDIFPGALYERLMGVATQGDGNADAEVLIGLILSRKWKDNSSQDISPQYLQGKSWFEKAAAKNSGRAYYELARHCKVYFQLPADIHKEECAYDERAVALGYGRSYPYVKNAASFGITRIMAAAQLGLRTVDEREGFKDFNSSDVDLSARFAAMGYMPAIRDLKGRDWKKVKLQ